MDSIEWMDYIIKLGSMVGAVGVLGNVLIKMYKKYVTDPYNRVAEDIQKKNSQDLKESIAPLTIAIDRLNHLLEESQADRKALHAENDAQDIILDNHEIRIAVLEDWRKGHGKREGE